MEERNKYKILFYIFLVVLLVGWLKHNKLKEENSSLKSEVSDYQYALEQANENIEGANSNIENAKSSTWSTYQDMGDALDNLETVDTVSEP